MWCDQNIRVCTNDTHSGSPAETINLVAGVPLLWSASDPLAPNPFSTNVSTIYVTNVSGASATLHIRHVVDPVT